MFYSPYLQSLHRATGNVFLHANQLVKLRTTFDDPTKPTTNIMLAGNHLLSAWSHSAGLHRLPDAHSAILMDSSPVLYIAPGELLNITVFLLDELLTRQSERLTVTVRSLLSAWIMLLFFFFFFFFFFLNSLLSRWPMANKTY